MPDSTGFGSYVESGTVIPCTFEGKEVNYTAAMYLNDEPPIAAGREVWGFPKKRGNPVWKVVRDTVVGEFFYHDQLVASGSMTYKYEEIPKEEAIKSLSKTQVNLKIIPKYNWEHEIVQLISYNLNNINLIGAWQGDCRLNLFSHINSPAADLKIKRIIGGKHYKADITLPYGNVLFDYLKQKEHPDLSKSGREKVLKTSAMPMSSPSFNRGTHIKSQENIIIQYESDKETLLKVLPDHLFIRDPLVVIHIQSTEEEGIGEYKSVDVLIKCYDKDGNQYYFNSQGYSDSSSSITKGREVFGKPFKFGEITFKTNFDTLNVNLTYSGQEVFNVSMKYKESSLTIKESMEILNRNYINLKLIPDVKGQMDVAQLISYEPKEIIIKKAFRASARVHMLNHVHVPISDFPIVKMLDCFHIDCVQSFGTPKLVKDYLKE